MGYRNDCVKPAVEDFVDWLEQVDPDEDDDIHSAIYSIVQSYIPVMTASLLRLALEDLYLAVTEPEIEFSEHTAFNAIYGAIFDEASQACWAVWHERRGV